MALVHIAWMWSIAMDRNIGPLGSTGWWDELRSTGEKIEGFLQNRKGKVGGFHVVPCYERWKNDNLRRGLTKWCQIFGRFHVSSMLDGGFKNVFFGGGLSSWKFLGWRWDPFLTSIYSFVFFFFENGWGKPPPTQLNRSFGKQATMLDGCVLMKLLQNEGSSIAWVWKRVLKM